MNDEEGWKIDLKETLLRNSLWIAMEILIFAVIFIALTKVEHFTDQGFQLMYLVFCLIFTLKLLNWGGHPRLILREIKKRKGVNK